MADEWTNDQANQITALYGQLKGEYKGVADQTLFGGPQLPYIDAFNTLNGLIEQQEREQHRQVGGLEKKATTASSGWLPTLTPQQSGAYLVTLVTAIVSLV